jgi:hypothetical protein
MADDLASGVEAIALAELMKLEQLLAAHAGFDEYLKEQAHD